jgi:hypothetical protein
MVIRADTILRGQPQHVAHHLGRVGVEAVVTHRAPGRAMVDLHPATPAVRAANQSHVVAC